MESKTENRINEYISHLDITSYQLAKQMETHKTNPVLGFELPVLMQKKRQEFFIWRNETHRTSGMWRRMNFCWIPGPLNILCSASRINMENYILVRWNNIRRILRQIVQTYDLVYMSAVNRIGHKKAQCPWKARSCWYQPAWWMVDQLPCLSGILKGAVGLIAVRHRVILRLIRGHSTLRISLTGICPCILSFETGCSLFKRNFSVPKILQYLIVLCRSWTQRLFLELNSNRPAYNITGYLPGTAASEGDDRMILLFRTPTPILTDFRMTIVRSLWHLES